MLIPSPRLVLRPRRRNQALSLATGASLADPGFAWSGMLSTVFGMDGDAMIGSMSPHAVERSLWGHRAGCLAVILLASTCSNVMAQTAPEPKPVEQSAEPAVPDGIEEIEGEGPASLEEGKVPLNESFESGTGHEPIRKQRKQAFKDTQADLQLRTYLLDRDNLDGSQSSAIAVGGYAGFRTGWFRDRFAIGATAYTSQRLYGPQDKDGSDLLQTGQRGYSVLGEAYVAYRFTDSVLLDVGRKLLNTPYINKNDSRMTPNTFELAILQGVVGSATQGSQWRFGLGYVDAIKPRTSEIFISMAEAAGAPDGVNRGVAAGGLNFQRGKFSIGAIDYRSNDIINIFYAEAKYDIPLPDSYDLRFGAQYSAQQSTGNDLLTGSDFSTWQYGVKAELGVKDALLTAAWNENGNGADLESPWGGIPSYNSVQLQDFNRAGEHSLMLRAAYDFKSVQGLSMYGLWVNGSKPDTPGLSAQDEYDLNLQWAASDGTFKGLSVHLRYAVVTQDIGGPDQQEVRLIINYDPPSL
jgi:hypothetical protein